MPGFWDIFRNRHKEESAAEPSLWGNFEVKGINSGSDVFIKGDNFDMYANDRLHADELQHFSYPKHKFIDISPASIEGIHLGKGEAENSSVFWSQHAQGWGTADSFKQIASHIPEVKQRLDAGESLADIQEDPDIGTCASIYFANKPKVYECDGYYEFDSNGRHRILAARELGYDIPVEVIGYYGRNEPNMSETPTESPMSPEYPDSSSHATKSERAKAVDQAWKNEQDRVRHGEGTRNWSVAQQAELLDYGKVTGFEGSHMMNVKDYPEYAANPDNIQFLPSTAHFEGVHEGYPRGVNPNGRFDENTGEVIPAEDGQIPKQPIVELNDKYDPSQKEYHQTTPEMDQSGQRRHDDYYQSKDNHPKKSQRIGFRAEAEDNNPELQSQPSAMSATQEKAVNPSQETKQEYIAATPEQESNTDFTLRQSVVPENEKSGPNLWSNIPHSTDQLDYLRSNQEHDENRSSENTLKEPEHANRQEKTPEHSQDSSNLWSSVPRNEDPSSNESREQHHSEKNGLSM